MAEWLNNLEEEEREEVLADLASCFYEEEALAYIWGQLKSREIVPADYFVEFTSTSEGDITGAYLAYNGRVDYLNVTLPIWGTDVQAALHDLSTAEEKFDNVQALTEGIIERLKPFVEAIEGVIG
jgi:hypothetical protein